MQPTTTVALLGGVAYASWWPQMGHHSMLSTATVTETVHDGACKPSQTGFSVSVSTGSPAFDGKGGNVATLASTTTTIEDTSMSIITLNVPSSSTTLDTSVNSSAVDSTIVDTDSSVVYSTIVVEPLPTPPASPSTTIHDAPATSIDVTTTIHITKTSIQIISVSYSSVYPLAGLNVTAPYGNSTSLASTTYLGFPTGLTSASPKSPVALINSSSTCTKQPVALGFTAPADPSAISLAPAYRSYTLPLSTSTSPVNMSSLSTASSAVMSTGTLWSTTSLLPAVSYVPQPYVSAYVEVSPDTTGATGRMEKKQVGATVTATIDGVVVTWLNAYSPTTLLVTTHEPSTRVPVLTIASSSSRKSGALTFIGSHTPLPHSIARPSPTSHATSISTAPLPSHSSHSTTSHHSSSSVGSSSSPSESCTEANQGRVEVNFDDLPIVSADENSTQYAPFKNPYHNLFWSEGFSYVPLPKDPYLPVSPPHLGVFIVDGSANLHSENFTGRVPSDNQVNGGFGAGPNFKDSAFWFNAYTASIGCNDTGPEPCDVRVSGFQYDENRDESHVRFRENYTITACTQPYGCKLREIGFGIHFRNLTSLQIVAYKKGTEIPISWFMDDLNFRWSNLSCAAVTDRASTFSGAR